jgi:cytosine/uracil/thiamine/allantoin permease
MTTAAPAVGRDINNADPRLYNHDLAPIKKQSWKAYNIFAFWMSDVHSVAMSPSGAYWYTHGFNLAAVYALIGASSISFLCVMLPAISWLANFSWFIGVLAGGCFTGS